MNKIEDLKYLRLLSNQYQNEKSVVEEIIRLKSELELPKGTEHFITDLHGEYDTFDFHMRTISGGLKRKIEKLFGEEMTPEELREFSTLLYYPELKLKRIKKKNICTHDWYLKNIKNLIKLCKQIILKQDKRMLERRLTNINKGLISELLNTDFKNNDKKYYLETFLETIIELDEADNIIIALSHVIRKMSVEKLHVIGDIFDRGSAPHLILDDLMKHHNVDIQWGNHDVSWIGAGFGHPVLVATVLRVSLRYGHLETLEKGYGINLLPLGVFALNTYKDDPCEEFRPKLQERACNYEDLDKELLAKMHKAITVIQFKLEGQRIDKKPEFEMDDRKLLCKINYDQGTVLKNGKEYQLTSNNFPTVDPKDPYKLTEAEEEVINKLIDYFKNSEKLQGHIDFLYQKGSMYEVENGNLLYHGGIAIDENGRYSKLEIDGQKYAGVKLFKKFDELMQRAYLTRKLEDSDWLWYLWSGKKSPLFARERMATFERYFIEDKKTHAEDANPYFKYREEERFCQRVLLNFGADPQKGKIINGHTPIATGKGESPIKGNGKMLVIDGGFSKAYHNTTGIGGYTLISDSWVITLVAHKPFISINDIIENGVKIDSTSELITEKKRKYVKDTDLGLELKKQINDLQRLKEAYENHMIKEQKL